MLIIKANREQKQLFDSLIEEMGAQVVWSGRFIVMGDRLILEGLVRSLFFHLDIQKTEVELADLPTEDKEELEISEYPGLTDLIIMAVYAFEKFGILKCVHIGQDTQQLEQIFGDILSSYQLQSLFSEEKMEFYQSGIRITYEDVIETVIAHPQAKIQIPVLETPVVKKTGEGSTDAAGLADVRKNSDAGSVSVSSETADGQNAGRASALSKTADSQAVAERIKKYHARIGVLDRLSDMQKKALIRDIRNDKLLDEKAKEELYYPIQDYEFQERMQEVEDELKDRKNRTYAYVQKLIDKTEKMELFDKTKHDILEQLQELRQRYGIQEVRNIMAKVPQHVERAEYRELTEKLAPYEDIDMSEYKETLRKMRETLEIKEISNMLMQSQKKDRRDYMQLLRRIEEQGFAEENAAPYIERILDWVSELDKERLDQLLSDTESMDYDQAASVYETITKESFLPQLRAQALTQISRRLDEISLSECRLLVRALEKNISGTLKENPRHHFYPAEKILSKTVKPEELKLINRAVSAYAERKGRFEYPVFMVDTSKECNGRDGMLLTPEHLFYSTRLNGYRISIPDIQSVYVSSGLLNKKSLIAEEANGVRHKLPYAADPEELKDWAQLLEKFIRFLKTRTVSDKLSYESLEEQDTISCSRCGCVYHDENICPECGYKMNR